MKVFYAAAALSLALGALIGKPSKTPEIMRHRQVCLIASGVFACAYELRKGREDKR